ncbi:helix-turn-helix domain-containing protein [Streptomyces sp. NBC_01506]|uniref:helix-turn-helix domain-containing protein n=1 Tax=Streptomyces sp. NBC_01506 TaxID=2903887 RepID=UPI003869CC17
MATTEAKAFAELLSELKERSGRSYGVLAAKLHVSTSTLHRYCNGDAVPADFAAAERFGRLCGATGEEFVELHRRWILADEARRRSRSAQPPVAPVEAGESGEAGEAAEAVPDVPVAEPADLAEVEAGAPGGGAPRTPRTGRRKRLYITLAAAAVVAAVAVPALVFGPLDDSGTDRSAAASKVSDGGTSKSTPPPSATPSGSPSPGKSPSDNASPSDKAASAEKGAAGGEAGKGDEKGTGTAGGVPVTVSTKPYAFENPCSQRYLIDRPPTEVPPPPTEQDAPGWVSALGGVSSGSQFIELAFQGTGSETVVLKDLNVRVVTSGAPLAWNDFGMGVGCGGDVTTRAFAVDLDAGRPGVVPQGGQRDFPYSVSESDPEVFQISAKASARNVSWYLELEWSSGGREGTLRVDDHGKPFRTSGAQGRPSYEYPLGGDSKWEPAVEQDPGQYP